MLRETAASIMRNIMDDTTDDTMDDKHARRVCVLDNSHGKHSSLTANKRDSEMLMIETRA